MGLFDKLFGKKETPKQPDYNVTNPDSSQLSNPTDMLEEDLYWSIIEKSLKNTSNQEAQAQFLINEVSNLTQNQIIGFYFKTKRLLYDTYNSNLWCAGYIMNGGCSDDGFEYFRNWIISRGKETYYKAKQNPDSLIEVVDGDFEEYEFEGFWYVADTAFKHKTGKDLYDFIEQANLKLKEEHYPDIEFTWQEEDPESMQKICPRLFDKFWSNN